MVYTLLIIAGVVAAAIGASAVGWISYSYITRVELREPVPVGAAGHDAPPPWIVAV
jgi:hypothetical protein